MWRLVKVIVISLFLLLLDLQRADGQQNVNSLKFDGTNDYVDLGNQSKLKPSQNISVECWINPTSWSSATTRMIFSTLVTYGYSLNIQSGILTAQVYRNSALASATYSVSALSGWHHVAFTFNGRYIRLYLDGALVNTNNAGSTYTITYNASYGTTIGSSSNLTSSFFSGQMDELRVWSTVRTASQLSTNLNTELSPATAGMLAYYRFNQGTASGTNTSISLLTDISANALNGTLKNFTLTGSASNFIDGRTFKPYGQSLSMSVLAFGSNSATIKWSRPGANLGGNGVKLFLRKATTGTAAPVDGTDYTADPAFASGTQIGTSGWYCVYSGTDSSATVTNLLSLTSYRMQLAEYDNITGDVIRYNTTTVTSNPSNFTTILFPPTIQASAITFSAISTTSFTSSWTRGNGSNCVVFVKQASSGSALPAGNTTYTASTAFGSGTQIGSSGWYCVYKGTGKSVNITGLTALSTYSVMVCEYNGSAGTEQYLTTPVATNPLTQATIDYSAPATQASKLVFSSITGSGYSIAWTRGTGTSVAVFAKAGNSGTAAPVNNTAYTASTTFKSGTQIGATGWYCIYNGSGASTSITGLTSSTTYRIMVCEYNGVSGLQKYNTSSASQNPSNQATTSLSAPSTQSTNIVTSAITDSSFTASWTRGNGNNCAVFVNTSNIAFPAPVTNTTYTANATYLLGSQTGTSGWYCVYNGTGNTASVKGLLTQTTYYVAVVEYNGNAGNEKYLTTAATNNPVSLLTDYAVPTTQASAITLTSSSLTSLTVQWTRGSGTTCVVFAAPSATSVTTPVNNTTYTASQTYGSGTFIASTEWTCIYKGSGTSVTLSGLTLATSYKLIVYEVAGAVASEKYKTTLGTNAGTFTTQSSTVWNGTSWSNGAPDMTVDAVVQANYTVSSAFACKDLTIAANDTLSVQAGITVTVQGNITNSGVILLKTPSSNGAAGSLINYGTITNDGSMVAERYISEGSVASSNYVWHFMSPPVGSYNVAITYVGDFVCDFIESTNTWQNLKAGNIIRDGKGYLIKTINKGGKKIVYKGTFNTGDFSTSLVNTGATATNGYNLVGNPYPSAIDWNATSGWTKDNLSTTIWIWNPTANAYATWDGTTGTNGGSRYIPAMQGFFVKVSEGSASGGVDMTNEVRLHSATNSLKAAKASADVIRLKVAGNSFSDELVLRSSSDANEGYKMFSSYPSVPQIYALNNGENYAIYKTPFEMENNITVGFSCDTDGIYTLTASELSTSTDVYLTDNKLLKTIKLSKGTSYTFAWNKNDNAGRFGLKFGTEATAVAQHSAAKAAIWSSGKSIYAFNQNNETAQVEIFNIIGERVTLSNLGAYDTSGYSIGKQGIYVVVVTSGNVVAKQKVIIQ